MEHTRHEAVVPRAVHNTLRERIIAFHDRRLQVVPIAEKGMQEFAAIATYVKSEKGKAAMERMRPKIREWAKNVEVGAGCADMVAGSLGAVVAVDGLVGSKIEKWRMQNRLAPKLDADLVSVGANMMGAELRPRVIKGIGGAAGAGIFWGLRPITRLTYYVGIPMMRRISLTVDNILLRREVKLKANQVLVGKAKA